MINMLFSGAFLFWMIGCVYELSKAEDNATKARWSLVCVTALIGVMIALNA